MGFLIILVFGAIDFGRIGYTAMALTGAARAGALYGSSSLAASGDTTGMKNVAAAAALSDIGTITKSASRTCYCTNGGTTTTIACAPMGACAGTVRIRVSVTASKTFNMAVQVPKLPNSVTLSRTAIMRAQ
jgi:Flp pilus assembly protein TadG